MAENVMVYVVVVNERELRWQGMCLDNVVLVNERE